MVPVGYARDYAILQSDEQVVHVTARRSVLEPAINVRIPQREVIL